VELASAENQKEDFYVPRCCFERHEKVVFWYAICWIACCLLVAAEPDLTHMLPMPTFACFTEWCDTDIDLPGTGNGWADYDWVALRSNAVHYREMCHSYLSKVVGHRAWVDNHTHRRLSAYCSVTDEAFMFLVLENNSEFWHKKWMNKSKLDSEQEEEGTPLYTGTQKCKGKNSGWSKEGSQRFNFLVDFVMAERRKESAVGLETAMMDFWNEKSSAKRVVALPPRADEEEVFETEVYPGDYEEV